MGNWDRKNWIIELYLREILTDPRVREFIGVDRHFSLKEYDQFIESLEMPVHTEKAEQIVRFFIEYHDGELMPDRYGGWEPVRTPFTIDVLSKAIEHVCWPAGCLYLKKLRKYCVEIENEEFIVVFDDHDQYMIPKGKPSEYKTRIRMFFSKTYVKDGGTLFRLADDMFSDLGASIGCVIDQEDMHVIYECKK